MNKKTVVGVVAGGLVTSVAVLGGILAYVEGFKNAKETVKNVVDDKFKEAGVKAALAEIETARTRASTAAADAEKMRDELKSSAPTLQPPVRIGAGITPSIPLPGLTTQPCFVSVNVTDPANFYSYRCILAVAHDGFSGPNGWCRQPDVLELETYDGWQGRLPRERGFPKFSLDKNGSLVAKTDPEKWPSDGIMMSYGLLQFTSASTAQSPK